MKTQTAQHTPTPWVYIDSSGNGTPFEVREKGITEGRLIASIRDADAIDLANAAFIVKCVNAHEELLRRLKECYEKLQFQGYSNASVAQAIAKAEAL